MGDELLVSARIASPVNGGNFDEFDYARYLMRHGISGTGYVASGKWALGSSSSFAHSAASSDPSFQTSPFAAFPLLFEDPNVQESGYLLFLPVVSGHLSHGHALV